MSARLARTARSSSRTPPALGPDSRLAGLVGAEEVGCQIDADDGRELFDEQLSLAALCLVAEPHSEAELGVVLEERVVPGGPRPSAFVVHGVVGRFAP